MIDDLDYCDYGRIISGLSIGDIIKTSYHDVGIIVSFPRRNYADVLFSEGIRLIHLSEIDNIISI